MDVSEQKIWMRQWLDAGAALEAVRAEELAALDEKKNAEIAASFFPAETANLLPSTSSGLVEQQRIFLKALKK